MCKEPMNRGRRGALVSAALLAVPLILAAAAQRAVAADSGDAVYLVTDRDHAAVQNATHVQPHAKPLRVPRGETPRTLPVSPAHHAAAAAAAAAAAGTAASAPATQYPADLTYQGGPVLPTVVQHAIYLRPNGHCPIATCWGNPEGFLHDLSRSAFIHVTDQYVGATGNNRYPVGQRAFVDFTPPYNFTTGAVPLTDNDIMAVVHAVAAATGNTGYGHVYHVFLPQGTDECFDSTYTTCYSPDNLAAFAFCAYHGYADFTDIGHVLYSVEPFQNTPGCQDPPGTPNGQMADSTNDVLSHELFETLTDPDLDAWFNNNGNLDLGGQEIGDECVFIEYSGSNVYGAPDLFSVGEKTYAVQPEYDNARHGCTMAP